MGKLRSVDTSFWSDPFIEDLTVDQKLIYLYLITNEKTNMLGVYEVSLKKISYDTGVKNETVSKALELFERLNKIKYENNFLILLRFLKHQNYNPNMMKSAIDVFNGLPEFIRGKNVSLCKTDFKESFETLSKGLSMVRKVEVEYEVETEKEYEVEVEDNFPKEKFDFKKSLIDLGIEKKIVDEWLVVRKNKKATNSETAFNLIANEILKSELLPTDAIRIAVENSWSGFNAIWITNLNLNNGIKQPTTTGKQNNQAHNDPEYMDRLYRTLQSDFSHERTEPDKNDGAINIG